MYLTILHIFINTIIISPHHFGECVHKQLHSVTKFVVDYLNIYRV